MKIIEHRRHSKRNAPELHLSQEGIKLAESVGKNMSNYSIVVTSTLNRAMETATAMGFIFDYNDQRLSEIGFEVEKELNWDEPFEVKYYHYAKGENVTKFANFQLSIILEYMEKLAEGEKILFISHGGLIEYGMMAMFPHKNPKELGELFSYCEGFRAKYENNKFYDLELLRV